MIERRRKEWERETKKIKKTKWKLGLDLVGRAANKSTQQRANTLHTPPKYKATFLPPLPPPPHPTPPLWVYLWAGFKVQFFEGPFPNAPPPLPSPPLLSAVLTVMSRVKCTVYAGPFPKCLPSEALQARNKWSSQFAAAAAAKKTPTKNKKQIRSNPREMYCHLQASLGGRWWQYVVRRALAFCF